MGKSIWITGDTHGLFNTKKLLLENWMEQENLDKEDYLIVAGDIGVCWFGFDDNVDRDKCTKKFYDEKQYTTLWIDGNHENFDVLEGFPIEMWNGGKVHRISDNIIHLMRGQVFEIHKKKIFVMGGGYSIDKNCRVPGGTWWQQEMPTQHEYEEGLKNLKKHNNKVDYIITHTTTPDIMNELFSQILPEEIELGNYLKILDNTIDYRHWYFGHLHVDREIDMKHTALYDRVMRII